MATVIYELRLEITVPVEDGDDPRDYITQKEKSILERRVMNQWKLDGELTDIEVMDTTIIADEPNPRDRDDDDGLTYADPRDERDERSR